MTGRELILYILANKLEDEPVYSNHAFIGYVSAVEAAKRLDVGVATIWVWLAQGKLDGVVIGGAVFIEDNAKLAGYK